MGPIGLFGILVFLSVASVQCEVNVVGGQLVGNIGRSLQRLVDGVRQGPAQIREVNLLKKRAKLDGDDSLSYSEFRFIERSREDFKKCVRLAFTAYLSPELFFYSYVVIPAISTDNPWAWTTLPSTFDDAKEEGMRNVIKIKRRQHAVFRGVTGLMENTFDDIPEKIRKQRLQQLDRVKGASKRVGKSIEAALNELEPYYTADNGKKRGKKQPSNAARMLRTKKQDGKKRVEMCLDGMPWASVKDTCKSFGIDGMPNIFFLRRLNRGEISRHFDGIRKADNHISRIGVEALSDEEVVDACLERCISIDSTRSMGEMRKDISQWLNIVESPPTHKKQYNDQNLRLLLAGLHSVKAVRGSRFSSAMKSIVAD
jgi:predicted DNA-binding protein